MAMNNGMLDQLLDPGLSDDELFAIFDGGNASEGGAAEADSRDDVAIIGMSGIFPDADDLNEFWDNLKNGRKSIRTITRWKEKDFFSANKDAEDKSYSKWGALMDNIMGFDPEFFHINPSEAEAMDPQQRKALMESWHAFEDAGYTGERLSGSKCGIYIGIADNSYDSVMSKSHMTAYRCMGNNDAVLSGRLAYYYNTKGPAITVNTACSSSLAAFHIAYNSLRANENEMALVGGVNLYSAPDMYVMTSKCGMLSETGECRAFDEKANGFVPGEGVVFVVMKRLSDAVRDGDRIHAVIKGSALNQDGRTNGITSPNAISQYELQKTVFDAFGIDPRSIGYVEAHGTGTKLGDPIEMEALTNSFSEYTSDSGFCAVGSVKTNVGHTVAAAGLTGVIKAVLMLRHKKLVPSLGFEKLNPYIELSGSPFYINTEYKNWIVENGHSRRAMVSSFGFSGTNACAVLEEYNDEKPVLSDDLTVIVSAETISSLKALASKYSGIISENTDLAAFALTSRRRNIFSYTAEIKAGSSSELKKRLAELAQADDVYLRSMLLKKDSVRSDRSSGICMDLPGYCFRSENYWYSGGSPETGNDRLSFIIESAVSRKCSSIERTGDISFCLIDIGDGFADYLKNNGYARIRSLSSGEAASAEQINEDIIIINSKLDNSCEDAAASAEKVKKLFMTVRGLLKNHGSVSAKLVFVHTNAPFGRAPFAEACDGLCKAVSAEYPMIKCCSICFESNAYRDDDHRRIVRECFGDSQAVWYDNSGNRTVLEYKTVPVDPNTPFELKKGGNYLFTGGMGGVGRALLRQLCRSQECSFWLLGRRPMDSKTEAILNEFSDGGCTFRYLSCDVSDHASLKTAADSIIAECGRIDGIFHSAGVFRNGFIINKSEKDLDAVFASKIIGTCNLEKCFADSDPDFFVMFSSIASLIGKAGQSDYVYANRFIDCFRKSMGRSGEASGRKTRYISVNWPYWINGGMQLDEQDIAELEEEYGLSPMSDEIGIAALNGIMAGKYENAAVVWGKGDVLRSRLDQSAAEDTCSETGMENTEETVLTILRSITGKTDITSNTEIESLNIDSIVINSFNSRISKFCKNLSKTILYECRKVSDVCGYIDSFVSGSDKKENTAKAENRPIHRSGDVAVIGIGGLYPKAWNADEFWNNIVGGVNAVSGFPYDRWAWEQRSLEIYGDRIYCRSGGFLSDINAFDAAVFRISPKEAERMDPQERKLLETVFQALLDSGYGRASLSKLRTGVFVGSTTNSYIDIAAELWAEGKYCPGSSQLWSLANRISYYYDLCGPSIGIDTACSSGLSAIYYAYKSLCSGECDVAVAGGVNIYAHPEKYLMLCDNQMLSKTGVSSPFGANADGFVPGEGAGALILKPLEAAEADGDKIYGVIRAAAINHGGRSKGYFVPSVDSQEKVINECLKEAGISACDVSFIEAHGTGTSLGDPIEIAALNRVFGRMDGRKRCCSVGSVKSNIGHLEAAAGFASVTKVLMMLRHKTIPPTLNCEVLNPKMDLDNTAFVFPQKASDWIAPNGKRRIAGVSSFGAGGVNVHILLEEYCGRKNADAKSIDGVFPIPVTAMTNAKLAQLAGLLLKKLDILEKTAGFADIVYTLQRACQDLPKRAVIYAGNIAELRSCLNELSSGGCSRNVFGHTEKCTAAVSEWLSGSGTFEFGLSCSGHIVDLPEYPFDDQEYSMASRLNDRRISNMLDENHSVFGRQTYRIIQTEKLGKCVFNGANAVNSISCLEIFLEFFARSYGSERASVEKMVCAAPSLLPIDHADVSSDGDGKIGYIYTVCRKKAQKSARAVYTGDSCGFVPLQPDDNGNGIEISDSSSVFSGICVCGGSYCFKARDGYRLTRILQDAVSAAVSDGGTEDIQFTVSAAERAYLDRSIDKFDGICIRVSGGGENKIVDAAVYGAGGRLAFAAEKIAVVLL